MDVQIEIYVMAVCPRQSKTWVVSVCTQHCLGPFETYVCSNKACTISGRSGVDGIARRDFLVDVRDVRWGL